MFGSPRVSIITSQRELPHLLQQGSFPQRVALELISANWSGIQMLTNAPVALPRGRLLIVQLQPHPCLPHRASNGPSTVIKPRLGIGPCAPQPGQWAHFSCRIIDPTVTDSDTLVGKSCSRTAGTGGPIDDEVMDPDPQGFSARLCSAIWHACNKASSSLSTSSVAIAV